MIKVDVFPEEVGQKMRETRDKRLYVRYLVVKLSGVDGLTVKRIAQLLSLCSSTVRSYLHLFNDGGWKGLVPKAIPGRPPGIGAWSKDDWESVVGVNRIPSLRLREIKAILSEMGREVTLPAISTSLRKAGFPGRWR